MLRGIVQVDILALMSTLEFTDGMETLLKKAVEDLSATIIIVSDSNSIFIQHILEVKNLSDLVDKVFTNPAWWDNGKLCITPFHDQVSVTRSLLPGIYCFSMIVFLRIPVNLVQEIFAKVKL